MQNKIVEHVSKLEADLEEARMMLSFSLLERVRLEKEADYLADRVSQSGVCNRTYSHDKCPASLDCKDCWREKARREVAAEATRGKNNNGTSTGR